MNKNMGVLMCTILSLCVGLGSKNVYGQNYSDRTRTLICKNIEKKLSERHKVESLSIVYPNDFLENIEDYRNINRTHLKTQINWVNETTTGFIDLSDESMESATLCIDDAFDTLAPLCMEKIAFHNATIWYDIDAFGQKSDKTCSCFFGSVKREPINLREAIQEYRGMPNMFNGVVCSLESKRYSEHDSLD